MGNLTAIAGKLAVVVAGVIIANMIQKKFMN